MILTNNGALTIDSRAVDAADVVYQGGIAVRASTGAVYVYGTGSIIAEKTAITDGAIQTADQVIGSLSIPAGSLSAGDVFRVLATVGRDNGTDAYGSATTLRMGTAGTTSDTAAGSSNQSSIFTSAGTTLSMGFDKWYRVVSIGTNSVIEILGVANGASSWNGISSTSAAVGTQVTLTGYNLTTQAGFFTVTTTMGAATATKPRTGYMRLQKV